MNSYELKIIDIIKAAQKDINEGNEHGDHTREAFTKAFHPESTPNQNSGTRALINSYCFHAAVCLAAFEEDNPAVREYERALRFANDITRAVTTEIREAYLKAKK